MNPLLVDTEGMDPLRKRLISVLILVSAYVLVESWSLGETGLPRFWPMTTLAMFLLYYSQEEWPTLLASLFLGAAISTAVFHAQDPLPYLSTELIMSVVLTLVSFHGVRILQQRLDLRHSFHSREGVLSLCVAWFLLSLVMGVVRFMVLWAWGIDLSAGALLLSILLMELSGLMMFTPLLMLYYRLLHGKSRFVNKGLLSVLGISQLLLIILVSSSLSLMPFQSVFLLAMVAMPLIILSSYVGGFPGVTVSIATTALSFFFILPGASALVDWDSGFSLAVAHVYFLILSVTGLVINAALTENRDSLLQMNDRVAGNADLILDLLSFQAGSLDDQDIVRSLEVAEARILAMNTVHAIVTRNQRETVNLEELFQELWGKMRKPGSSIDMDLNVRGTYMDFRDAIYLALIFSELVSNSLSHAFPQGKGTITVQLRKEPDTWKLLIADDGIGMPQHPVHEHLGISLVENLVSKQLKGGYMILEPPGTKWLIWFPRHIKHT